MLNHFNNLQRTAYSNSSFEVIVVIVAIIIIIIEVICVCLKLKHDHSRSNSLLYHANLNMYLEEIDLSGPR